MNNKKVALLIWIFCVSFLLVHWVIAPMVIKLMPCDPISNLLSTSQYFECLMRRL